MVQQVDGQSYLQGSDCSSAPTKPPLRCEERGGTVQSLKIEQRKPEQNVVETIVCAAGAMRRAEFSRLEECVYLDHAGSTLYSERQLQETHQVITDVSKP